MVPQTVIGPAKYQYQLLDYYTFVWVCYPVISTPIYYLENIFFSIAEQYYIYTTAIHSDMWIFMANQLIVIDDHHL